MKRTRAGNWRQGERMRPSTPTGRALKMTKAMGNDPFKDLALVEVKKPSPGPGEVLTRVGLRSVTHTEVTVMSVGVATMGRFTAAPYDPDPDTDHSDILGNECYGIAEEVGEGVVHIKPGQRVIPVIWHLLQTAGTPGAWQDYVVTKEEDVYAVPDTMDDTTAAQFVWNPWSAYMILKDLDAPKGEYIICSAPASGMGRVIIQLAKHWEIKTICIVRSDAYTVELKALGADVVINSSTQDVVDTVMKLTNGRGAFGALDAVGGTLTRTIAGCLRAKGQILVYGYFGGSDVTVAVQDLARRVRLAGWELYDSCYTLEQRRMVGDELMHLYEEGVLAPMKSTRRFKFEDWKLAFAVVDEKGKGGDRIMLGD